MAMTIAARPAAPVRRLYGGGALLKPAARKPRLQMASAVKTVQARAGGAGTVAVTFTINRKLNFGQQMVLVGDAEELGAWELEQAPVLTWSEGDDWRVTLDLPAGSQLEYKFAVTSPHEPPVWEECGNRCWSAETPFAVLGCSWDSTEVSTRAGGRDNGGVMLDLPPAYRPAQSMPNSFSSSSLATRRDAVTAVNGAMSAASGATAAAEAVVAAAEAAAAAVAQAVTAAEAVVAELTGSAVAGSSSSGGGSALKAHPVNATLGDGHYSAEQLAFLNRKRSGSPVSGPAAAAGSRPAQQTAAAAAEAVLAATTAAAGAAAKAVAVAESVAAELLTNGGNSGAAAAKPAAARNGSGQPSPAASAGSYTPDQLEFMRRKLNSGVRAHPASGNGSGPPPPAANGHGEAAYSPEQLEFLRRRGTSPQKAAAAAAAPARAASPPRPSSRPRSPSPAAAASPAGRSFSPEQLAFMRRAGKA